MVSGVLQHYAECCREKRSAVGFATTFCIMLAGGDELLWRWVSGTRCEYGWDHLGMATEEKNGQRTGDAPAPPMGWQADGR